MSLKSLLLAGAAASLIALAACGGGDTDTETTTKTTATPSSDAANANSAQADFVFAQDFSDIAVDPNVSFGQLDNGMRYAILANDTPEETAAIRMRIDMGSIYESDDQLGLAHFLEHMVFNGSENVPEGEMIKILERYGLAFGPDTNAYTSFDETVYQLDLPSVEDEVVDTGLFLMREAVSNLTIADDAIDAERGVILSEERTRNTYGLRRFRSLFEFLLPDTIFPDRFPIGTVEVIETAKRDRFLDLWQRYYTPTRTSIIIVGDFDPADIEAKVEETFGDWEASVEPGGDVDVGTVDPDRGTEAGYFYDPDVPGFISITSLKPASNTPDSVAKRREDTIRALGNAIVGRRFDTLSRAADAPIISGSASYDEWFETAEGPAIDLTAAQGRWDEALALGEQELRKALEFGFGQSELDEQIANFRTNLKNAVDQAGTRESVRLANQITGTIASDTVFSTPDAALARFEALAADLTVEDVEAAFREQWASDQRLIHVSSSEEIENPEQTILAAFEASRAVEVEAPEFSDGLEFAYSDFGTPGEIVSDSEIEDFDIRQIVFDNNVRLNLKPTDFEDGIVRIRVRVGAGALELPADIDGLGLMMGLAFANGGLGAHSVDEIQTLTAGRSVQYGYAPGEDAFVGGYTTTPDDLELQLQLATAFLTDPGFRPEAEAQAKALLEVFYPTLDSQPQQVAGTQLDRILASGDNRFGIGPLEDLRELNFEQLEAATERAFSEGAIEVSLVGDFDEQTAIDLVASTFGALDERRAEPMTFEDRRDVSLIRSRDEIVLTHQGETNQSLAMVYWPTTDGFDAREVRRLNLLRAVARLRLTDKIREEVAASYSPYAVSSMSDVYPGYGTFSMVAEVEPEQIDTVHELMIEIADNMASGDITNDEIDRALNPILERVEEEREQNETWINIISQSQTKPEYIEMFREKEADYRSFTADDLTDAAATYFGGSEPLKVRIVHASLTGGEDE